MCGEGFGEEGEEWEGGGTCLLSWGMVICIDMVLWVQSATQTGDWKRIHVESDLGMFAGVTRTAPVGDARWRELGDRRNVTSSRREPRPRD